MTTVSVTEVRLADLAATTAGLVAAGGRFAGIFASARPEGTRLRVVVAYPRRFELLDAGLLPGEVSYPALTPAVPGAAWYERELSDLFGLLPLGRPRPDPLVLPPDPGSVPPGTGGDGMFTIPYGPVRSGVFESVEYVIATPGEEVTHLETRVHHKHRGLEKAFEDLAPPEAVLVAERVEGVASVAHASAFCQAVEDIAGVRIPRGAALVRVLHAELERVANHLDTAVRHTEAAGQAVAYARLSAHKERIMRLRAQLCGHRFGRGVVIPGGVAKGIDLPPPVALRELAILEKAVRADLHLLHETPSFVDRLRSTGVIPEPIALAHGALGPVGRGSGVPDDARIDRPYGGYDGLAPEHRRTRETCDALARQHVRTDEIGDSFLLARRALEALEDANEPEVWSVPCEPVTGESLGWCEAPQGELLYLVEMLGGRVKRAKPRSASFHNLALFSLAFPQDILTDFAFIEASFGYSVAGVSG
jgi:formate hydrogenlyase subunit 5